MVFLITWDYSFMLFQILPIVKKYFAYQLSNVTIVKATVIICFVKCCTQQTCSALTSLTIYTYQARVMFANRSYVISNDVSNYLLDTPSFIETTKTIIVRF